MAERGTRRSFLKTAGAAAVAAAARPASGNEMMKTLGLLGCAHIHLPSIVSQLTARDDVRVKWAWDADPRRGSHWAEALGARRAPSAEEVLADPEVKGVVVLSETRRHLELIEAAARAGKHVFVEKPLGTTAAESRAMAAALEKAGVLFNTAYFMRANPRYLFLREQVKNGAFGRITRASAWNCHAGALEGWFDEKPEDPAQSWRWMANPREAGGGGFADLGTHSFDLLMWLFGPVESVCAEVRVVTGRYGESDDTGTALLRMRDGLLATVMAGWADVADPVALQIAGTEGHAVVFRDQLLFESRRVPDSSLSAPVRRLPPGRRHPLGQWLDALGGGPREGLVTAAEAAERVAAMEAAYTSARSGGWIKVGAA